MKKYDGLYIFAGQAKDDVLEGQIAKAVAEVTRLGGNILWASARLRVRCASVRAACTFRCALSSILRTCASL